MSLYGGVNVIIAKLVILCHLLSGLPLSFPGKMHSTVYAVVCKNENSLIKMHLLSYHLQIMVNALAG